MSDHDLCRKLQGYPLLTGNIPNSVTVTRDKRIFCFFTPDFSKPLNFIQRQDMPINLLWAYIDHPSLMQRTSRILNLCVSSCRKQWKKEFLIWIMF